MYFELYIRNIFSEYIIQNILVYLKINNLKLVYFKMNN